MTFDKFKQQDGSLLDADGVAWQDVESYILGQLNFCGCGCPSDALQHIRDGLAYIAARKEGEWDQEEWFFAYWADAEKLTEHCSSIRWAWLTDKGTAFLSDLLELYPIWIDQKKDGAAVEIAKQNGLHAKPITIGQAIKSLIKEIELATDDPSMPSAWNQNSLEAAIAVARQFVGGK